MYRNQNKFSTSPACLTETQKLSSYSNAEEICHGLIFPLSGQSSSASGCIPLSYTAISSADISCRRKTVTYQSLYIQSTVIRMIPSGSHHPLIYFSFLKTIISDTTAQNKAKEQQQKYTGFFSSGTLW